MKRHALFVALLCLSSLFFTAGRVNALTIPASEDSYTAPGNKLSLATNNANGLLVDATRKSYLYFDLSDIPTDAVVRWAKLRLFLPIVQRPGAGLSVHLVTSEWNESRASNSLPTLAAGTIGVIAPDKMASRRFVTVDVTSTVQSWIKSGTINAGIMNEGFAVQPIVKAGSPTASVMLTSKDGPVFGLPAELDIEFQPDSHRSLTTEQVAFLGSYFGPTITAQPSAPSSSSGSLTVTASGMGPLTYEWRLNGLPIAGGTSSQLPTQGLLSGTYTVVVSNPFTSVTSASIQYPPSLVGTFALVTGGTLPASSPLGAVPVDTFYIGKTEVTWGEWHTVRTWAVTNGYPDLANVGKGVGESYPVSHVNWYDVVKWCNARSEKEGKVPVYKNGTTVYRTGNVSEPAIAVSANGYRLPSEAEWEFAARGGTQTQGYTYSGSNDLNAVGWYGGNSGGAVKEVGDKKPNELGIFDMSGNMFEWTGSWYPGDQGTYRVIRGGGWNDYSRECAVARSSFGWPGGWDFDNGGEFGFRVATSGKYAIGITAQPSVSLDGTTLGVEAAGAGTLTYQWSLNGLPIAGGTSSQLPTQGLQSGTYTVVVSNGFASVTSVNLLYPSSPIGTFALVTGGTLPASSPLGAVPVDTFYIGKTEVTWGEWKAVRTWAVANGYTDLANVGKGVGDTYPVSDVNWYECVKWCNARSEKEGKTPVYKTGTAVYQTGEVLNPQVISSANGYRLPSEKEWEWAARGGTKTQGYTYSGSNDLNAVGWYNSNSNYVVQEVSKKQTNELGIYDMSGNLYEWCLSWYPGSEGVYRVFRGGYWGRNQAGCEIGYRDSREPGYNGGNYGFRVALNAAP